MNQGEAADRRRALLEGLFSSRVRLKVLARLVGQPGARCHARELAKQTGEHFNAVWQELKHLEALGLLKSEKVGNQVQYRADPDNPLLPALRLLVAGMVGGVGCVEATPAAAPPAPPAAAAAAGLVMGETD